MSKPYTYERARDLLATILDDMRTLSGDQVGPSGATWQDVAGTAACNMRVLANLIDAAREGRVSRGPAVFPSPDDLDGATLGCGADDGGPARVVSLSDDEINLITSALDSHVYWQLSESDNRNDGYVVDDDEQDEHHDERKLVRALESKLSALVTEVK